MKYPVFRFDSFSARKRGVSHGGDFSSGKRKTARPLDPKQAIQITLTSSQATGAWSFLHPQNSRAALRFITKTARRWNVRILACENRGQLLCFLVRVRSKVQFQRFLRELTGGLAQIITGARKGRGLRRSFWDHLAFTLIVPLARLKFDFRLRDIFLKTSSFDGRTLWTAPPPYS